MNVFDNEKLKNGLLLLILVSVVLVICRIIGSRVLPIYDDAFITFRYGRNLALGQGFVYNPGESVLGTTTPLFGLICALLYFLGLSLPKSIVLMNIILDIIIFYITVFAMPKNQRVYFGVIFGLLFALSPTMTRVCVGAMEMNLYLACLLLSIFLYMRGFKTISILIAGASYYLRPEALVLVFFLCTTEFLANKKIFLKLSLISICTVGLPLIPIYFYYGQILPQSMIAKSQGLRGHLFPIFSQFIIPDPLHIVITLLAFFGFIVSIKQKGFQRAIAILCLITIAAFFIARPSTWAWYGELVYYSLIFLATVTIIGLINRKPKPIKPLLLNFIVIIACGVVLITWLSVWFIQGPSSTTSDVYKPLEKWCNENIEETDRILAYDIGAIGYYSNAYIYDLAGLVWPERRNFKSNGDVIKAYLPDYLFLTAAKDFIKIINENRMNKLYKPIARFPTKNEALSLSPDNYSKGWTQEYIMFKKI